jgi:hypothetical protein
MIRGFIIIIGIIAIIINLILNYFYFQLYQNGHVNSSKRLTFKILREALLNAPDIHTKNILINCKKLYLIFLILFFIDIILILYLIFVHAYK